MNSRNRTCGPPPHRGHGRVCRLLSCSRRQTPVRRRRDERSSPGAALAEGYVLEHLEVTVGVAERKDMLAPEIQDELPYLPLVERGEPRSRSSNPRRSRGFTAGGSNARCGEISTGTGRSPVATQIDRPEPPPFRFVPHASAGPTCFDDSVIPVCLPRVLSLTRRSRRPDAAADSAAAFFFARTIRRVMAALSLPDSRETLLLQ